MLERLLSRVPLVGLVLLPALMAAVLYVPAALRHDFVSLDDSLLITKNPAVQEMSGRSLRYIVTHYDPELYIPLTFFSYQIDDLLWGLNPIGFHLTNVLLHALSAALVALIGWKLSKSRLMAFIVGLLFAVHPLNTEAVMWAAARKDVLSSCLALASAACFLTYRETDRRGWYRGSVALFFLALLAKVSVVVLPGAFLLHDAVAGRHLLTRERVREYVPYAVLALVFAAIALYGKSAVLESTGPLSTVLFAGKSASFYFRKLLWPTRLAVIYLQRTPVTLASSEFAVPLLATLATLAAIVVVWVRGWKRSAASAALFFLFLLPNSTNFFKNGMLFFASDRYAYLAALGLFGLAAYGIARLDASLARRSPAGGVILGAALVAAVACLGADAVSQAATWTNSETLYRRVVSVYPDSPLALNNLGDVLMKQGRRDEAMAQFDAALRADPGFVSAHLNRGLALQEGGKTEESLKELRTAVELAEKARVFNMETLGVYYYLGEALEAAGKSQDDVLAVFHQAVEKLPDAAEPHYNLGIKLQKYGKDADAAQQFATAVKLEPLYADAWYHLAGILAEDGRLEDAATALEQVLSINPNYPNAREHLVAIQGMLVTR